MKAITRQELANDVAERWYKTYYINGKWRYNEDGNKLEIYRNLKKLGDNPNPDQIDIVIGNTSWTELRCDECDMYVDSVVRVGGDIDYGSAAADLCKDCIDKIVELCKE